MIPQPLSGIEDGVQLGPSACKISERWGIAIALSTALVNAAGVLERFGLGRLLIISGSRTEAQQDALRKQGRPTAPPGRSTHTSCPATGADVWLAAVDNTPQTEGIKGAVVLALEAQGLRVGGGGKLAPNGLPIDWNHTDLGPRPVTT